MAKNYKQFNLLEVADISGVRVSKYEGTKKYIATADIGLNKIISGTEVTYEDRPSRADLIMKQDEVLFAKMKSTKKVLSGSQEVEDLIFSTGFYILKPKENVSKRYLYFFLLSDYFNTQKDAFCSGATMAAIGNAGLKKIQISIPVNSKGGSDFEEQERMASLLEEAEKLQEKRTLADQKMEEMIPALFNEMFGNLLTNPKKWPTFKLREVSQKFSDGPFGSNLKSSHYQSQGVRVIRLQNIGIGEINDNDKTYVSREHFQSLIKHRCLPGDVIVATLGDPNLRAIILPEDISEALNKADCVQIRPKDNVTNSEYLCWLMNMPETLQLAIGLISGQTRSRISMGRLAGLEVPVPPLKLQEEFAEKVREILMLKKKQKESAMNIQNLFSVLLSNSLTK